MSCTIDGCESPSACRTWCWKHYDRWRRNGDPNKLGPRGERGTIVANPIERFWSKVDRSAECWNWNGRTTARGGYGSIYMFGKVVLAHRWSYEQARGPIPHGLVIDHLCRNTRCVNPDHLEAVTVQENSRRAGASRTQVTACGRGHQMVGPNVARRRNGLQYCRECARETQRTRRARARATRGALAWADANPDHEASGLLLALLEVL